jgi:hypothetical protein
MPDDRQGTELAARLTADEQRIEIDEARMLADEQRLLTDEARLERIKGPVVAVCPVGTRVLSGGAAIRGAVTGASLVRSEPDGASGWTATARVTQTRRPRWRLAVSAVCASGGE